MNNTGEAARQILQTHFILDQLMGKMLCCAECNITSTDNTSLQTSNTHFQMTVYYHVVNQG